MLESLVTVLEDNEPVISAAVGVTTMLAAAWGVFNSCKHGYVRGSREYWRRVADWNQIGNARSDM